MNLNPLKTNIERHIANGSVNLSNQTTGLKNLEPFLEEILALKELAVSAPVLKAEDKKLILNGKINLFKFNNLDLAISFTEKDDTIHFHIKVSLPVSNTLPVPGLAMGHIAFQYFGSGAENVTAFIGGHTTVLGKTEVSVKISLPALEDELYISSSAENIPVPEFAGLVKWADPNNDSLNNFLPPDFGKITKLSVSNFGVVFIPSAKTVNLILLTIKADEFALFPGTLAIKKIAFSLQINNPFSSDSKDRSVSGELSGNFVISNKSIPVSLSRDGSSGDWNFRMTNTGWNTEQEGLNFGELMKTFAGEGFKLPDFMKSLETITLERLEATFNLGDKSVVSSFGITITSGKWDIIPGTLAIDNGGVSLSVLYPADGEKRKLGARVWGTIAVGQNLKVMLAGSYDGALTLSGQVPEINIKNLLEEIFGEKVELPAFIPDVSFTNLGVTFTPSTGEMSLTGGIETGWKFGEQSLTIALSVETSFNIRASGRKESLEFSVTLDAKGTDKKLTVLEGLELEQIYVEFSRTKDKEWWAGGGATVWLFDQKIETEISYATDATKQILEFSVSAGAPEQVLVNFEDLAVLYGSSIKVKLTQDENKLRTWELGAAGRFNILELGDLGGALSYKSEKDKTEIALVIEKSDCDISLLPELISARLKSAEIRFGKKAGKWAFEASSELTVKGLPKFLYDQKIIPDELKTSFRIDGKSITFTLKEVTGLMEFEIPVVRFSPDGPEINLDDLRKLGKPAIQLVDLKLSLGKQSYLSVSMGFRFPEKINNIFGEDDKGEASIEIFETSQLFKLKFGIGYKNSRWGVFCVPDSSPFKKIELSDGILKLDFGEYGLVEIKVPEFSSGGADFNAAVGFKVSKERPLHFPLLPFKKMLEQTALGGLSKILPNKVPIKGIEFFKDGKLQVKPLIDFLGTIVPADVLGPIENLLNEIAKKHADKLPKRLTDYLNINLLESFDGNISVTAAGGVNINIDVKDSPIRMLYPMLGTIPSLQGITLRGFSFGTVLGGILFSMKIDADFDNFDLASLLAGLILPELGIVPPEKDFHERVLVHNLFMLIAIVKGIPIPVPLFYDRLGIDTLGIEGTAFNANAFFKAPQGNPMGILKMISSMRKFFTDKDAKLVNPPDAPQLEFRLADCYLQLPPFLGGAVLGVKGELFKFNLLDEIVKCLNLIKFFDPVEAMLAVRIEHRFGKKRVSFGPLSMEADWLFTSIEEFTDRSYLQIEIPADKKNSYLELIGSQPDKGFVTFLKGKSEIAELAALNASFGLVAKNGAGMMTHYRIEGFIKGLVYFHSKGTAALKHGDNKAEFLISGETYLKVGELEVFKGHIDLKAKKDAFDLDGGFRLLPKDSPVNASGDIKGSLSNNGLTLSGGITANFGLIVLADVRAEIHYMNDNPKKGVWLSANFFGQPNTIDIEGTDHIKVNARLESLRTTLVGEVILEKQQVKTVKATANIFDLFGVTVLMAEGAPGEQRGQLDIRSLVGLPFVIKGNSFSHPNYFQLTDVTFWLFPAGSPLNITGTVNATFTKDSFNITGGLQPPNFLSGVFGGCSVNLTNTGLSLTASLLGRQQTFDIRSVNGIISLKFDFWLSVLAVTAHVNINADGSGGSLSLTCSITGILGVRASVSILNGAAAGQFYLDFFIFHNFLVGNITVAPGAFSISGRNTIKLLNVITLDTYMEGRIDGNGTYLSGTTTLSFQLFNLPAINHTARGRISNNDFYVFIPFLGGVCFSVRLWQLTITEFGYTQRNPDWARSPLPCLMVSMVAGSKYLYARRLDGAGEVFWGAMWNSWGDNAHTNWPRDMRADEVWNSPYIQEIEEETEPMALLEVAKKMLFTPILHEFNDSMQDEDEKRMHAALSKYPVFLNRYPDPDNEGLLATELVFQNVADDNELIKELKSEISKSGASKTSGGIVESKSMDIVFSSHGASGQTTITVSASNKTDFNDVSASFDFDKPAEAYHELALSV